MPKLLGWDAKRRRARADELLALVGLDPARYRDRYPSQLSGGERQRVGVARALAVDPPVMLMDEPFGAVDPIVRERLQDELLRLQEQLARTILFVTHDIDEAIRLGDVVAVFQTGGILAQFDTPDTILAAPASEFVARFVGTDRGLKRLSLSRRRRPGAAAGRDRDRRRWTRRTLAVVSAPTRHHRGCCCWTPTDGRWAGVHERSLPPTGVLTADLADPSEALLTRRMSLRDALSVMLAADVITGVVVDDEGRALGILTVDQVAGALR